MGVIRGGLFIILSVLLFISFLIGGLFLTINLSLDYEVIKPELSNVVTEVIEENADFLTIVEENIPVIDKYCENNSEFVFSQEEYLLNISCESIENGTNAIVDEGIGEIVEEVYYKDYECGFIQCFKENLKQPFFLVSKTAKDFWANKFYLVLFTSLIIIALMFFLIETKSNLPIITGTLLIISSFFFIKLDWISSLTPNNPILKFVTVFFTQSTSVFWWFLIIGVLILVLGIFLKFFDWGFKISEFIGKFQKGKSSEVKKEIKKQSNISKEPVKQKKKPAK